MKKQTTFNAAMLLLAGCGLSAVGYFAGVRHAPERPTAMPTTSPSATSAPAKALWTCSMHPQVIQDSPGVCPICHMELVPMRPSHQGDDYAIQIDPAIVQNMGVRTAVVTKGPLVRGVRTVGYLEEPEGLHRDVNLRVNGWIEKLYADTEGMIVSKGMPLFDLYSPELTVAIDEMILARKQAGGDATANAILDSSRRKLLQLGLEASQVQELAELEGAPRTVPILATLDGHLTVKMVYEGAAVKAGDLVMRLASRTRMWIDAQVYEQQMPLISNGQPARITMVSQPGKVIEGKVLVVQPHVDPRTRTAIARIEIPNQDMKLRQGMYAMVEILADSYEEATVIPREAVIDSGRRQIAFVSVGDGRFEPRELRLGAAGMNDTVQVLSGVVPGENVVTSGQFLLDSESRVREAIARFAGRGAKAVSAGSDATTRATQVVPAMSRSDAAAPPNVPHADQLIDQYLSIAKRLGERETETATPMDVAAFSDLTSSVAVDASADAKPLAERLANAVNQMKGKTLEQQREAFIEVSSAMIAIANVTVPNKALYRIHCPMAFNSAGADWLQSTQDVANPYYAKEMKACGTVEGTMEARK